ncbi:MAG: threonylcarbamoyl-AMP synthase [Anaerolineaceae bacterium]|nr:threonylcarbamoyl-AMP synthase [Anaerolineaceae bacterium]MBN2676815.1 threonylcarbamoyl-AMP synthase [Anaerolineaceae bacterium]
MKTFVLLQSDPLALQKASEIIIASGLVAFPTDTVYGVGVRADKEEAIEQLYMIKARSAEKPIPVMLGNMKQLKKVVRFISPAARRLAERFWPGPLTLILPKRPNLPVNLTNLPGIGVRIPDHPFARALCLKCGPLAVTSANLSGNPEALNVQGVLQQLNGKLDLVVDGGDSPGGVASTVVDITGEKPCIIRSGLVTGEMITQALWVGTIKNHKS